jgi:hypothetical protein
LLRDLFDNSKRGDFGYNQLTWAFAGRASGFSQNRDLLAFLELTSDNPETQTHLEVVMPLIHFACPNCHKKLKADPDRAPGSPCWRVRCPVCEAVINVPKSLRSLVSFEPAAEVVEYIPIPEDPDRPPIRAAAEEPQLSLVPNIAWEPEGGTHRTPLFMVSLLVALAFVGIPLLIVIINAASKTKPGPVDELRHAKGEPPPRRVEPRGDPPRPQSKCHEQKGHRKSRRGPT